MKSITLINIIIITIVLSVYILPCNAQSGCSVGSTTCSSSSGIIMQTLLIQTDSNGITQVQINVSNYCYGSGGGLFGALYVEFLMTDSNGVTLIPQQVSGTFSGHYNWDVTNNVYDSNIVGGTVPKGPYLKFAARNYGGSSTGTPQNFFFTPDNKNGYYDWEIFRFYVKGYVPQYKWYWVARFGTTLAANGPLDMSQCYCSNCDSGYNSRIITPCTLGYPDSSTPISNSVFNEDIILLAFAVSNNRLQMFFSDEHPLAIGVYSVTGGPAGSKSDFSSTFPRSPADGTPICITGTPYLQFGPANYNSTTYDANVDGNDGGNSCTNKPGKYLCGRPLGPALFLTDLGPSDNPVTGTAARAGDWQQGGSPIMPTSLCGVWKGATKSTSNAGGYWTSAISVDDDQPEKQVICPTNNPGCSASPQTAINFGPGADPLPIWDQYGNALPYCLAGKSFTYNGASHDCGSTGKNQYGAEAVWDLSILNLAPSHSFRLQFMCHDGDQTNSGGDVGQACVTLTAQCPPGFTNTTCTECEKDPAPHNGQYIWFCVQTGALTDADPYTLRKIPKSALGTYTGFIPDAKFIDALNYSITCDCQRVKVPCNNSCCGNGQCNVANGQCACFAQTGGGPKQVLDKDCCPIKATPTPTPVPPSTTPTPLPTPTPTPPPCYNDGKYCNGQGVCNTNTKKCDCFTDNSTGVTLTFSGDSCNITIYPPPAPKPTCGNFSANCSTCITDAYVQLLNCEWCPTDTGNITTYLTSGTCMDAGKCPSPVSVCAVPPVVELPPCPDDCLGHGTCSNVTLPDHCFNNVKDGDESDVDCGKSCFRCVSGKSCLDFSDCQSGSCDEKSTCGGYNNNNYTGNVTQKCVCLPGFSGDNCGISAITTNTNTIIEATVGAGVLAGIIIAVVAVLGCAGGGALAVYSKMNDGGNADINSNPLYKPAATSGVNPLHRT